MFYTTLTPRIEQLLSPVKVMLPLPELSSPEPPLSLTEFYLPVLELSLEEIYTFHVLPVSILSPHLISCSL